MSDTNDNDLRLVIDQVRMAQTVQQTQQLASDKALDRLATVVEAFTNKIDELKTLLLTTYPTRQEMTLVQDKLDERVTKLETTTSRIPSDVLDQVRTMFSQAQVRAQWMIGIIVSIVVTAATVLINHFWH